MTLPPFRVVVAKPTELLAVKFSNGFRPAPAFEIPPVLAEGYRQFVFVSTSSSWVCRVSGDLFAGLAEGLSPTQCALFSSPVRIDKSLGTAVEPSRAVESPDDWRRSYEGVTSANVVLLNRELFMIAITQGENKNERSNNLFYKGSINLESDPQKCASGWISGEYKDCWESYNGFINAIVTPVEDGFLMKPRPDDDMGPLIWPSMGYLKSGEKTSWGVRRPRSIVVDDYIYTFYVDTSRGHEDGREGGLHVARTSLGTAPALLKAIPFFAGAFSEENASLPDHFSKQHIREFYGQPGGRASSLWQRSSTVIGFSVARLRQTPFFLGVEENLDDNAWSIRLRISRDLVHWSAPIQVPDEMTDGGWRKGTMHYPILYDDSTTDTDLSIDANHFLLLGTRSGGGLVRKFLSLRIEQ